MVWLALLVGGIVMVGAVGALIAVYPLAGAPAAALSARARAVQRALLDTLPGGVAGLVVLLTGIATTVAVCWPLGSVFKVLQPYVDVPLFRFAQTRQGHPTWTAINQVVTQMGNRYQVKIVCLLAAVVLAVLWRKRGWWIPPVVIAAAFGAEKYDQKILAKVVDRGHPPTTLGTYPSGGCARLIAVYGVIAYLVVLTRRSQRRTTRLWIFSALAAAAFTEGYTRTFLLKHWFTDVVGGWVFGSALLAVLIAATATLVPQGHARPHTDADLPHRLPSTST